MRKRTVQILSLFFAVLFCISAQWTYVFAEELTKMTVQVESVTGKPGDEVKVKINLKNNPGIASLKFDVSYDEILTLEDVELSDAFTYATTPQPYKNPQTISMMSPLSEVTVNGTVATLTFLISESAEDGYEANVSLTYDPEDIFDGDLNNLDVKMVDGTVSVSTGLAGDINLDGKVNQKDAMLLFRYIGGESVDVYYDALDVNGDNKINVKDAVTLFRFIAGWEVTLYPPHQLCSHNLTATARKEATCTEDGNIAYWYCDKCCKYYSNENATMQITLADTVIAATGHTVVKDPYVAPTYTSKGWTEGSHCSKCNEVLVKQEYIDPLVREEYAIEYEISNGDEYLAQQEIDNSANPLKYATDEGVTKLANVSVPGYRFLGWYDLPSGDNAEIVKSIPAGSKGNFTLYAKWEKIEYKVAFESSLIPIESETYTVDQRHPLPTPKLDGYIFAGWSDGDGDVITSIPEGTIGAKTYTANWVSERNQAWTYNKIDRPYVYEDEESDTILFIYRIGEIRNVPVKVIEDFGKINANGITKTVTKKHSKTIDEGLMNTYTDTVKNATTNSFSWTLAKEWSNSTSVNEEWAKENQVSEEDINTTYKDKNSNWYTSKGSSGSNTSTTVNTESDSMMLSSTRNTKTDDFDSNQTDTSVAANLDVKNTTTIGAKVGASVPIKIVKVSGEVSLENKTEVGVGLSASRDTSAISSNRVQTDNTDSAQYNSSSYSSTGMSSTASWNSESGYGGSETSGQSVTASKAISETLSEKYNIGKSYINTDSESNTQATQTSAEKTNEYSSAVTYSTITSEQTEETFTTENTMSGYHRWILVGKAYVFAVVGYDIATKSYFTTTYSIMDDEYQNYEDYSYQTGSYDDNQSSTIKFSIPMDIVDYVDNKTCASEGLEISKDGIVTRYSGTDDYVVIPEYAVITNKDDGSKNVVKVTGMNSDVFAGKKITGIELSDYITEIPANAFKGCSSLSSINATGITKIGDNAFSGCTSLGEMNIGSNISQLGTNIVSNNTVLTVSAANKSVAVASVKSGAKDIYLRITDKCTDMNNTELTVPNTVQTFIFNGFGKNYSNLKIVSDASNKTIINRATITSSNQMPLIISSPNVEINEAYVTSPGICLALTASETSLALWGESKLTSSTTENAMLCKKISFSQSDSSYTSSLTVNGNMLICTSENDITSGKSLLKVTGKIVGITANDFDNYLKGLFNVTFNANGGNVSQSTKTVIYGSTYGELPTPTRDNYVFDGWYTAASGGTKITSSTVFNSTNDVTLYAHWTPKKFTVTFNANGGSVSTSSKTLSYGDAIGTLPTPTRDYYTFNGWYTAASGGTKITTSTVFSGSSNVTVYAQWTQNSVLGWTVASSVPSGAQIVETKWTYTFREFTSSGSSSLSGWTKYDTQRTSWGSWSGWSTSNPSNGVRNVEYRSVYDHTEYHYYRWTNGNGYVYTYQYSSAYWLEEKWFTYELPVYNNGSQGQSIRVDGSGAKNRWVKANYEGNRSVDTTFTRDIYRDEWRYQDPVYTYYYYRDVSKETTASDPTGQTDVYNVVKYVKYRAK